MAKNGKLRLHVKNDEWSTPEFQQIFTITPERYASAAARHPDVAAKVETFIDGTGNRYAESIKDAEILVGWEFPRDNLREVAPRLRWIHVIGAGVEHLSPMDWLPQGVTVTNNKGAHADKGGEFGLMAVLMLHNHVPALVANQNKTHWESLYSTPIAGRTVLVIGVGNIGGAVARRVQALGCTVIGVSRHGKPAEGVDEMLTTDRLDSVLPQADYVFVATPLTTETRNLLDRRRLRLMKRGSSLANVGRAGVVDYEAVMDLLRTGHLAGAILDVFDPEPLPADSPLWRTPNLIVTPHVSSDDGDSYMAITLDIVFANLRRYLAGEKLRNIVRPDLGY